MDSLVIHLSEGEHPVTVGGPKSSSEEFRKRIEEVGYVFVKFTSTRGGTDLGFRLDQTTSNISQADFVQGSGIVHLEGISTLNYFKVRCVADIDLHSLNGSGHLTVIEE